jgi:AcrR family transcriptional regulator
LANDSPSLTFARIAQAAQVNRSTVHQHYDDLHELIADALVEDLRAIAEPLDRCPFDDPAGPPTELMQTFAAVQAHHGLLARLTPTGSALVTDRLRTLLADLLGARFASGARPPGFDQVPARVHADYIAGGLTALLCAVDTDSDTTRLAAQGWDLIAGTAHPYPDQHDTDRRTAQL